MILLGPQYMTNVIITQSITKMHKNLSIFTAFFIKLHGVIRNAYTMVIFTV